MPHLRCRGLTRETVVAISETLVEKLADLTKSPAAHFTVEYIPSEFIPTRFGGNAYPFIEVFWFPRPQDVQDSAAKTITEVVKAQIGDIGEVAVVFQEFVKTAYYDDGKHYG